MDSQTKIAVRRVLLTLLLAWAVTVALIFGIMFATRALLRLW